MPKYATTRVKQQHSIHVALDKANMVTENACARKDNTLELANFIIQGFWFLRKIAMTYVIK